MGPWSKRLDGFTLLLQQEKEFTAVEPRGCAPRLSLAEEFTADCAGKKILLASGELPRSWLPVPCQPCRVAELLLGWGRKSRHSPSPALPWGIQGFRTKGRFWDSGWCCEDRRPSAGPVSCPWRCSHPLHQNQCSTAMPSTWQAEMQNWEGYRTIPATDGLFRGASSLLCANK